MSSIAPTQSFFPALLRAFWMLLGNGVILVLGLTIARLPPWSFSWRDALFVVSLICLVSSRWVDAERYGGATADGEPMTRALLLRWTALAVASAAALWTVAQSIGF